MILPPKAMRGQQRCWWTLHSHPQATSVCAIRLIPDYTDQANSTSIHSRVHPEFRRGSAKVAASCPQHCSLPRCESWDMKDSYLEILEKYIVTQNFDLEKIKILAAITFLNMAPLHNYPFDHLLMGFGAKTLDDELFKKNNTA